MFPKSTALKRNSHDQLKADPFPAIEQDEVQIGTDDCNGGWRSLLGHFGISRAIIRFSPPRTIDGPRRSYLIGFDPNAVDLKVAEELLDLADAAWSARVGPGLVVFPLRDMGQEVEALTGQGKCLAAMVHVASGQVVLPRGELAGMFFRSQAVGDFSAELCGTLECLFSIFLDSAAAHCEQQRQNGLSDMLRTMFDQLVQPTILVDADAKPLLANFAARKMLRQRKVLLRTVEGIIAAPDLAVSKDIRAAVVAAVGTEGARGVMGAVRVGCHHEDWLLALVVPTTTGRARRRTRAAIIVVLSPHSPEPPGCVLDSLGLIPSEQRFLDYFLRASSIPEAAQISGLSEETARTYLKRVRAKLGTHRQMDLARLIYGLVPPFDITAEAAE